MVDAQFNVLIWPSHIFAHMVSGRLRSTTAAACGRGAAARDAALHQWLDAAMAWHAMQVMIMVGSHRQLWYTPRCRMRRFVSLFDACLAVCTRQTVGVRPSGPDAARHTAPCPRKMWLVRLPSRVFSDWRATACGRVAAVLPGSHHRKVAMPQFLGAAVGIAVVIACNWRWNCVVVARIHFVVAV